MSRKLTIILLALSVACTTGKIYDRCELARELMELHEIPEAQVATWVCIAKHESLFNTSAVGHLNWDGSGDHGLFQISDIYWCSPPGKGWACGLTCNELEDEDIENDVVCAKRIHREHQRLSGDGFNAWTVYPLYCKGERVKNYLDGCFDDDNKIINDKKSEFEPSGNRVNNRKPSEDVTETVRPYTQSTTEKIRKTATFKPIVQYTTENIKKTTTVKPVFPYSTGTTRKTGTYKPIVQFTSTERNRFTATVKPKIPHSTQRTSTTDSSKRTTENKGIYVPNSRFDVHRPVNNNNKKTENSHTQSATISATRGDNSAKKNDNVGKDENKPAKPKVIRWSFSSLDFTTKRVPKTV